MKHIKNINESNYYVDLKPIFKDKIDWKAVNFFVYTFTKFMDAGFDLSFMIELDYETIWELNQDDDGKFGKAYEVDLPHLNSIYDTEGFQYVFFLRGGGKTEYEKTYNSLAIKNEIEKKYNIKIIESRTLKYGFRFFIP